MKQTKIVCTLGPASETVEDLISLIKAGMNVGRLNFSHDIHENQLNRIKNARTAAKEVGVPVAILLDTKGPEIRTGKLKDGKDVALTVGKTLTISTDECVGDENRICVSYDGFARDLVPGNTILIDDGLIELTVTEVSGNDVKALILNNGMLGQNKGVNLPNVRVNLPALAPKDIADLEFGCKNDVDFVAPSFIRKVSDVLEVRDALDKFGGKNIKIISKIENQEGLDNFDEILEVSDGIMVARGDLGVEIPISKIPLVQKEMIRKCNEAGKPVITATQMLESMIKNPRPTRAEVTDIANAILDGTDAIMLSGETAKGAYPAHAVKVMSNISSEIDPLIKGQLVEFSKTCPANEAVAKGCVRVAVACGAKAIVVGTHSGRAACEVRRYSPEIPVLALADDETTARQMLLVRGVTGELTNKNLNYEQFVEYGIQRAKEIFKLKAGDLVVVTYGQKIYQSGTTNSIRVLACE
ncbi:MAG: pyruvate kinase [Brevinema sp.]